MIPMVNSSSSCFFVCLFVCFGGGAQGEEGCTWCMVCKILVPQPEIEPRYLTVKGWSPN